MQRFAAGHATHPDWRMAAALVLAQLRAQLAEHADDTAPPGLGLLYLTDHYAASAQDILDHLGAELPQVADWAGAVGIGIAASGAEYIDEPAMSLMLCALPSDQYRVFSGVAPLAGAPGRVFTPHTALVHADPAAPDLPDLLADLAERTATGYLFGGLCSGRDGALQLAQSGDGTVRGQGASGGVFRGGLSGVAFGAGVRLVSRVTQGCQPVSPEHEITAVDANLLLALDGEPALDVLLRDLDISLERPQPAIETVRATLAGLRMPAADGAASRAARAGDLGPDVLVRHIIGLDPARRGVALADAPTPGTRLTWVRRNQQAARADLVRICAEIRDELEPAEQSREAAHALAAHRASADAGAAAPPHGIAGAIYISCAGRGGPHFGAPSAELQIVRHALGDVPLVGFFAGGEIARQHLYGYTGVLTVFAQG